MLRMRFTDGPRKGQIAEVSPEAGWAMLKDGRATDPRLEHFAAGGVAEAPAPVPVSEPRAVADRVSRRGGRR